MIHKFGDEYLQGQCQNTICRDNLEECVAQAKSLIEHMPFVLFVSKLSNKSTTEVRKAFAGQGRSALAK